MRRRISLWNAARGTDHNFRTGRRPPWNAARATLLQNSCAFFTTQFFLQQYESSESVACPSLRALRVQARAWCNFLPGSAHNEPPFMCAEIRPYPIEHGTQRHRHRKNRSRMNAKDERKYKSRTWLDVPTNNTRAYFRHGALSYVTNVTITTMIYLIEHSMAPKTKIYNARSVINI